MATTPAMDPTNPISTTVLELVGAHIDEELTWTPKGHWREGKTGRGFCGRNCPCCRARNAEDWMGVCWECIDLFELVAVNRAWKVAVRRFHGVKAHGPVMDEGWRDEGDDERGEG